jgi:pyrimidine-nucleoside phosphorylase
MHPIQGPKKKGRIFMRAVDIIIKKREGQQLSFDEINFIVIGYVNGQVPDYQASAFLMAAFLKGFNDQETADLTQIMRDSGDIMDLSRISKPTVDKHSTGGVGDKTSLIVAPLLACFGFAMPKMSGRGLGHTGGTIDKLESIPGFTVELSKEQFINQVEEIGLALTGQTGNITPADKKLYALRDVTGTVDSIPLIVGSIMSKKLASGAETIVLDVKCGSGAFMKELSDAEQLATSMVEIGKKFDKKIRAIISSMNQPLGYAIGNALEVIEVIELLKNNGPKDLYAVSEEIAVQALLASGKYEDSTKARKGIKEKIESKEVLNKFSEFIKAQGGNPEIIENYDLLQVSEKIREVRCSRGGYISKINTEKIGYASMLLGAGRATKEDVIDMGVGINYYGKIGKKVAEGDLLAEVYYRNEENLENVVEILINETIISDKEHLAETLIYKIIT